MTGTYCVIPVHEATRDVLTTIREHRGCTYDDIIKELLELHYGVPQTAFVEVGFPTHADK